MARRPVARAPRVGLIGFDVVIHIEFAEDAERENAASLFEQVAFSVITTAADAGRSSVGFRELSPTYKFCVLSDLDVSKLVGWAELAKPNTSNALPEACCLRFIQAASPVARQQALPDIPM
jgi:hypothetical protein